MVTDKLCAMPMTYSPSPAKPWEFGPATYSSVPKVSGGTVPIVYDRANARTATLTNTLVRYSLHTSYDLPLKTN